MLNITISLRNNQEKNKISLILAQSKFSDLLASFDQQAVVFKVINYLLLSYKRHKGRVFPGQQTIADYAQCSREYVNRIIKMLCDIGLLWKKNIQYTSCSYWLHPIFHDTDFRWKFKNILSALRWSPLFEKMRSKLASGLNKAKSQITLYYNNYYYPTGNNNNYLISKNSYSSSSQNYEKKEESMYDSHNKQLRQPKVVEEPKPIPRGPQMSTMKLEEHIREGMNEPNLSRRLIMFKDLYTKCHGASQPYVHIYIKKTLNKIAEQQALGKQQIELPF